MRANATEFLTRLGGNSKAPVFMCACDDGQRLEFVVKLCGGRSMGPASLVAEWMAACLGRKLNIPIPLPAIVYIDPRIADFLPDDTKKEIKKADEFAFGSHYVNTHVAGWQFWQGDMTVTPQLLTAAADIYAFDALIENTDRSFDNANSNSNLLYRGGKFCVIDHEKAFDFLQLFLLPPDHSRSLSTGIMDKHIFRRALRTAEALDFSFSETFVNLLDEEVDAWAGVIPPSWLGPRSDYGQRVATYIKDRRESWQAISEQIRRSVI